ncbi:MAG: malonyl-ACP O-methyltransferase BioC [Spongiibacteraceae bacterium]
MTKIFREYLPSTNLHTQPQELVLLHGWGSDSAIWRSLLPELRQHFNIVLIDLPGFGDSPAIDGGIDELLEILLTVLPPSAIYMGWSLGGMLATYIAGNYPERVEALITLGSNAKFVADASWPQAMPATDYRSFHDAVAANSQKGLRRFQMLQCHGDPQAKTLKRLLQRDSKGADNSDTAGLLRGLNYLTALDNRAVLDSLTIPVLHLFSEVDALVPHAVCDVFQQRWPKQKSISLAGCGHLAFLSAPATLMAALMAFLNDEALLTPIQPRHVSKRDVARSFSRAAQSYDGVAELQRRVVDHALQYLGSNAAVVVDIGCGTGYAMPALHQRFPNAFLSGVDLAEGMLQYAAQQRPANSWVCGDAENLPLADDSVGQIFSSLAIQWCENNAALFAEIERVLVPGGRAVVATLGPETLYELRDAWRQVDDYVHVNNFVDEAALKNAITQSGLRLQSWQQCSEVLQYSRLSGLTRELKDLGAHNVNEGRPGGLSGRQRIQALTHAYETFRNEQGLLPASYQVWYMVLEKPEEDNNG